MHYNCEKEKNVTKKTLILLTETSPSRSGRCCFVAHIWCGRSQTNLLLLLEASHLRVLECCGPVEAAPNGWCFGVQDSEGVNEADVSGVILPHFAGKRSKSCTKSREEERHRQEGDMHHASKFLKYIQFQIRTFQN